MRIPLAVSPQTWGKLYLLHLIRFPMLTDYLRGTTITVFLFQIRDGLQVRGCILDHLHWTREVGIFLPFVLSNVCNDENLFQNHSRFPPDGTRSQWRPLVSDFSSNPTKCTICIPFWLLHYSLLNSSENTGNRLPLNWPSRKGIMVRN